MVVFIPFERTYGPCSSDMIFREFYLLKETFERSGIPSSAHEFENGPGIEQISASATYKRKFNSHIYLEAEVWTRSGAGRVLLGLQCSSKERIPPQQVASLELIAKEHGLSPCEVIVKDANLAH